MYLIYLQNKVIGYTTSWQEADDICKNDYRLSWKFTNAKVSGIYQVTVYSSTS